MATARKTTTTRRTASAPSSAVTAPAAAKKTVRRTAPAAKAAPADARPVAKPLAMPAAPAAPAKPAAAAKTVKPVADKALKPKKPKMVRDSFTIPKAEYTVLDELKQRSGTLGQAAKKTELLRAGIKLLAGLSDAALVTALQAVPAIKTGRPSKD